MTLANENKKASLLKIIGIIILSGFIISLVPVLYASFFSHPLADDYSYSSAVHHVLENGGSLFDALGAAFNKVYETYFDWQGTFSAVLVFSLQPGVFSDDLYFLTTFIMVISLTLSTFLLFETIIVKYLKMNKWYAVIIAFSTLFVTYQFLPNKKEALYWFNGSSYYTLFYSISLLFFVCLIRLFLSETKIKRILLTVLANFLGVLIGGSNYTTALVTVVITFLAVVYSFYKKGRARICFLIVAAVLLAAFMISVVAPGNSVRASNFQGNSPVSAIIKSFCYSFIYVGNWTQLPQVVLFVFISPLLMMIAQKSNFSFKYPLVAVLLFFCIFSAQMTPALYAMNSVGSGRQIDIYYYAYYMFVIFSLFYFYGWLIKKHSKVIGLEQVVFLSKKYAVIICLCFSILFVSGSFTHGIGEMTSVDTAIGIINGTVEEYDREYEEIKNEIVNNKDGCAIEDIQTCPDFFGKLAIDKDADYWTNRSIASYFDCASVVLK